MRIAAAGFLLRQAHPLSSLLDAFVIGAAFSMVLWTIVVGPQIRDLVLPIPQLATVAAYPVLDIVMLSILTVGLLGGRPLDLSMSLFAVAVFAFLVSDVAYAIVVPPPRLRTTVR